MMNIERNPFPSSPIARQCSIHCLIIRSYVVVMNNDNTMIGSCLLTCGIDYLHCATKASRAAACVAYFLASFAGSYLHTHPSTPWCPREELYTSFSSDNQVISVVRFYNALLVEGEARCAEWRPLHRFYLSALFLFSLFTWDLLEAHHLQRFLRQDQVGMNPSQIWKINWS